MTVNAYDTVSIERAVGGRRGECKWPRKTFPSLARIPFLKVDC